MKLMITEIFYSLQGEGSAAGQPFLFIRFARCNLRCVYCDTGYSFDAGNELSIEEILGEIERYPEINKVLITGGEPLMQKEGLLVLIDALEKNKKTVYLETNGSLDVSEIPHSVVKILDIKTPSSGFGDSFLEKNIFSLIPTDELKFVIGSREDFDFSADWLKRSQLDKKCAVLFSPVFGRVEPKTLAGWILKARLPVKLNLQIHKILDLK